MRHKYMYLLYLYVYMYIYNGETYVCIKILQKSNKRFSVDNKNFDMNVTLKFRNIFASIILVKSIYDWQN